MAATATCADTRAASPNPRQGPPPHTSPGRSDGETTPGRRNKRKMREPKKRTDLSFGIKRFCPDDSPSSEITEDIEIVRQDPEPIRRESVTRRLSRPKVIETREAVTTPVLAVDHTPDPDFLRDASRPDSALSVSRRTPIPASPEFVPPALPRPFFYPLSLPMLYRSPHMMPGLMEHLPGLSLASAAQLPLAFAPHPALSTPGLPAPLAEPGPSSPTGAITPIPSPSPSVSSVATGGLDTSPQHDGGDCGGRRARKNYKNMTRERRVEANARERTRVHTISAAFDSLRQAVPSYSYNQRLSKLAILRIACSYIMALARLADLDYADDHDNISFADCVDMCTKTIQAEGRAKRRH